MTYARGGGTSVPHRLDEQQQCRCIVQHPFGQATRKQPAES